MGYIVRVHFEGVVNVQVFANPEDPESWADALADAWADVPNDDLSEAASAGMAGHDIIGQEDTEECDECGDMVPYINVSPDGAVICQGCFDKGLH